MRIFLLFIAFALSAKECHFIPPAGWEIAQLKTPSPHVKVGFIGKGSTEFRPSINLATEEVDVSLKEYVKAVKELQTADPNTQWRDLGKLSMKAGEGRLIEMTNSAPFGEVKIFQALFVQGETAYILTAAALKQDLANIRSEILQTFKTFNLIDDLWSPIPNDQNRTDFKTLFLSLGTTEEKEAEWQKLQMEVQNHSELGPFWQFLALEQGHSKIFPKGSKK